ncbi:MAG: helix-turn-helix domain-containing protein [Acidobacteriaceae bacterium]
MPENPNKILADNLRALRTERGWSQEDLADKCGLHRTYIGAIERGERNVTLATLNRIASAFGTSSAELISESRRAKNPK